MSEMTYDTGVDTANPGEKDNTSGKVTQPVLIIVMGVSGTGKSTLGSALAKELGMPYIEGDDLHPKANIDKMSSGQPLNDQDREPWLELIRKAAEDIAVEQQSKASEEDVAKGKAQGVVAGCSALKKYYREILRGQRKPATESAVIPNVLAPPNPATLPTYFVFVTGPREVLYERMEKRPGHFFKASMLDSQLSTLEDPSGEDGVVSVSLESSTEEQVRVAKAALGELIAGIV